MDVVASPTEDYESDDILRAGDVIEVQGRRWQVSSAPLVDPSEMGETADVMVWPADS